jgi:SNF2 family DNA or RNA helicase
LFAQYRFLDPNIIGMRTHAAFTSRFCVYGGFEQRQIVGYRNLDQLTALVAPYTSRVTKADCLDLPPKVYVTREVQLSAEQQAAYADARAAFEKAAESDDFEITTALELLLRLRQVIGGHLPDGRQLVCPRIDTVKDLVLQAEGPVIVWAVHRAEITRLVTVLQGWQGRCAYRYDGGMTDTQAAASLDMYKGNPRGVLIANPAKGGTGLNLDGATLVIYYSHSFRAGDRWQSEDRTHRATTRHSVTYVDLVTPRTIEPRVIASLRRKQDVSALTLDELRDMVRAAPED